jgi:tricorn protease
MLAPNADGKDARDVTVVPIGDEDGLRNLDWIEGNRRKVGELSGGKVAYVYMPNTGGPGYTNFNRYFYSQLDKQALVLDERYNEGGLVADYVVDVLKRFPLSGRNRARRQADSRSGRRDLRAQGYAHQPELRLRR